MDKETSSNGVKRFLEGWRHSTHSGKICREVEHLLDKTPTKKIRHMKQQHYRVKYVDQEY